MEKLVDTNQSKSYNNNTFSNGRFMPQSVCNINI